MTAMVLTGILLGFCMTTSTHTIRSVVFFVGVARPSAIDWIAKTDRTGLVVNIGTDRKTGPTSRRFLRMEIGEVAAAEICGDA